MARPDYGLVSRLLAAEVEAVLETLATDIKYEGGEIHAHLANGDAVVVAVRGSKRGVWLDKSDMSGGDTLALVHRALGKDDYRVAFDWGKKFLGLSEGDAARQALADRREVMRTRQVTARRKTLDMAERVRLAIGHYLSGGSLPFVWAPQLASYLASRGMPLNALPGIPKTLRFAPRAFHRETERDWPAMLAPIVDPIERKVVAVHRTFLAQDGAQWIKAPIKPAKKVSAEYRGGIIPLLRGASGKRLGEAPDGEAVMIAEGIENALAAAILLAPGMWTGIEPAPRVFAAISASNLPHLKLPPSFAEVVLICDRDPEYRAGVAKAYDLAERQWLEAGLAVTRRMPPAGCKDFTEWLERGSIDG